MAQQFINGVLHEVHKTYVNPNNRTCTKCGEVHGLAWVVSMTCAHQPYVSERARYCYDCTRNHWATAFRLYRESMGPNGFLQPRPAADAGESGAVSGASDLKNLLAKGAIHELPT